MSTELLKQLNNFNVIYKEYIKRLNEYNNSKKRYTLLLNTTPEDYCETMQDESVVTYLASKKEYRTKIADIEKEINREIKQYRHDKETIERRSSQIKSSDSTIWYDFLKYSVSILAIIIIPLSFIILLFTNDGGLALLTCLIVSIIVSIIYTVYNNYKKGYEKKAEQQNCSRELGELDAKHEHKYNELCQVKEQITKQLNQLDSQQPQIIEYAQKCLAEETQKLQADIENGRTKCAELLATLKAVAIIPDENDWPRIDRIVHLIKSGRATSLSAALILCDQEDRHNKQLAAEAKRRQEQQQFQEEMRQRREVFEAEIRAGQEEERALHAAELLQQKKQHEEKMAAAAAQISASAIETAALHKKISDLEKEINKQSRYEQQ